MPPTSTIELTDLVLTVDIGTYGPTDVVPDAHMLDLVLWIDPALVLIDADGMDHVFDYDPLIAEIDRLARDGPYETQERLITRILGACSRHPVIEAAEIWLRKSPVLDGSGALGVRIKVDGATLKRLGPVL
ncbi:MAG: dihydroneopterin aldolase [Alphaproteobacteria bacterium]